MSKMWRGKSGLLLMALLFTAGFGKVGYADEGPVARWVCSASELTSEGVTKELLNVVFIPDGANKAVVYANKEYRIRFEHYQNPLDKTWEIAVSLNEAVTDQEIFRAFAQDDSAVGFKKIDRAIGGYCRATKESHMTSLRR